MVKVIQNTVTVLLKQLKHISTLGQRSVYDPCKTAQLTS